MTKQGDYETIPKVESLGSARIFTVRTERTVYFINHICLYVETHRHAVVI